MQHDFDVVVCEAGPAGAAASLFLSQKGIHHLLFDQAVFPRTKVCGDGITPVCTTILEQVIPDIKKDFAEKGKTKKITSFRVYGLNHKYAEMQTSDFVPEEKNLLFTISRFVLDDYLLKKASDKKEATVWQNTKLLSYLMEADGVQIQLQKDGEPVSIFCKIIIAADGDRSIFRKKIYSNAIDRKQMVAAIRAY
jgi:flavin-dependent dehydrogenase